MKVTCSGCGEIHEIVDDVALGDFILVKCSCGVTTKFYTEMKIS